MIQSKTIEEWRRLYPQLADMTALREILWINTGKIPAATAIEQCVLTMGDVLDASRRLERFAPYIQAAFPETKASDGILESPIVEISNMQRWLRESCADIPGALLLKCDNELPISGSIKARGGIYEVLKYAEDIAVANGMLTWTDDYAVLAQERFRKLFSGYSIAVGSTGNLGLSIGIISAKLGFSVTVHMSADARRWKKELLRSKGCRVIEYAEDYSKAVEQGREQAREDPKCHFVDDENSRTLFLGYAVSALRLNDQLHQQKIAVDERHPLFVYLPCGVGGGPGGVAFGIKLLFGDNAHIFFAEPTHAPCMTLGLVTGLYDQVSVREFGLDNRTIADGLAVGRSSSFVGRLIQPFLSGCATVADEKLSLLLRELYKTENIFLEASALAGFSVPVSLFSSPEGAAYIKRQELARHMEHTTHIVWATGGSMVPQEERELYLRG